jgi:hypothetical protein
MQSDAMSSQHYRLLFGDFGAGFCEYVGSGLLGGALRLSRAEHLHDGLDLFHKFFA